MSEMQDDADRWRKKYRETLFELERKERDWRETETLLRLAVSRAALAAQGSNPRLDALLSELRAAVRGELNRSGLQRTLTKLREALYQSPDPEPEERSFDPAPFLRVLGKLPPALAASVQEAVPRLEAAGDVDTCLDVLVDLFRSGGEAQAYPQGQLEGLRGSLLELLDRLRLPEALDRRARALADELPGARPDEVDEVLAGFATFWPRPILSSRRRSRPWRGSCSSSSSGCTAWNGICAMSPARKGPPRNTDAGSTCAWMRRCANWAIRCAWPMIWMC